MDWIWMLRNSSGKMFNNFKNATRVSILKNLANIEKNLAIIQEVIFEEVGILDVKINHLLLMIRS